RVSPCRLVRREGRRRPQPSSRLYTGRRSESQEKFPRKGSLRNLRREISFTRDDIQARPSYAHFHAVIILRLVIPLRRIGQRVLISRLLGHSGIKLLERISPFRVVNVAPGVVSIRVQPGKFAFKELVSYSHAVNGNVVTQQFFHDGVIRIL